MQEGRRTYSCWAFALFCAVSMFGFCQRSGLVSASFRSFAWTFLKEDTVDLDVACVKCLMLHGIVNTVVLEEVVVLALLQMFW